MGQLKEVQKTRKEVYKKVLDFCCQFQYYLLRLFLSRNWMFCSISSELKHQDERTK